MIVDWLPSWLFKLIALVICCSVVSLLGCGIAWLLGLLSCLVDWLLAFLGCWFVGCLVTWLIT
jgi:hypothetical protein